MREATARVAERAQDVRLLDPRPAVEALLGRSLTAWTGIDHYSGPADRVLRYVVVLDSLNFSFWGGSAGGYKELARRLRSVFQAGDELAGEGSLAGITPERLAKLIGPFPMMTERAASLRDLGRHGFRGLVEPTAAGTAAAVASALPGFRDMAPYATWTVPLLKRAQILAADLHGAGVARFPDLADLTCFADYKLPQLLRHLGCIAYSDRLASRIDGWVELAPGEPAEVEIRSATVVAVERIRDALSAAGRDLTAVEVDWLLWDLSQHVYPMRPYHRTRTIFY